LVAPVGTNLDAFVEILTRKLKRFSYETREVRVSSLMSDLYDTADVYSQAKGSKEYLRIDHAMARGNELRLRHRKGEVLALASAGNIAVWRGDQTFRPRTAHVLRSLKHPDEVRALRRIYGTGFFLLGLSVPEERRRRYLSDDKRCTEAEVDELLRRDEHEDAPTYVRDGTNFGQRTRDTFQLADAFVRADSEGDISRFLDLVFGCPFITPSPDEHAMFLAYASALRSADLSRQVGAVIVSQHGDLLSVGTNDVARAGGGLYWPGADDKRDFVLEYDSNEKRRTEMLTDLLEKLRPEGHDQDDWRRDGLAKLRASAIMDITEYGRAVHAEMEAILACARNGVSPRSGTLYCTTFPCHNCAKHIVDVGLRRVVYVEPYPKSQARELFKDSIVCDAPSGSDARVHFEPFIGVGARRFLDLFSLSLASGISTKKRKSSGGAKEQWEPERAVAWTPLLPNSYLDREKLAAVELAEESKPD
jgi:deoxycytidylate deaminase